MTFGAGRLIFTSDLLKLRFLCSEILGLKMCRDAARAAPRGRRAASVPSMLLLLLWGVRGDQSTSTNKTLAAAWGDARGRAGETHVTRSGSSADLNDEYKTNAEESSGARTLLSSPPSYPSTELVTSPSHEPMFGRRNILSHAGGA